MEDNTQEKEPVTLSDEHWNGEQRLNKSTGEVEVYYNGMWCVKQRHGMGQIFLAGLVVIIVFAVVSMIVNSYDEWKDGIVGYKPDWLKEQEKNEKNKE